MPARLNLPIEPKKFYVRGDTFNELVLTLTDDENNPVDLTGKRIRMDWKNERGQIVRQFDSVPNAERNLITIDPLAGEITIEQFVNNTDPGLLEYDLQISESDNIETVIGGYVNIKDDVTK